MKAQEDLASLEMNISGLLTGSRGSIRTKKKLKLNSKA
jgi:hypothetical protein